MPYSKKQKCAGTASARVKASRELSEQPACGSEPRSHDCQTDGSAAAMPEQLSPSLAHEIKEPISAMVINAGTALWLLNVQPTNMEAVRRLLARVVDDGMRVGGTVDRNVG
jgi:hypothetical protein